MSYFLVMHGTLGSGKSTCAKKIAKILDGKRIDLDEILKENKLDHQVSDSACIPAHNFIKGLDLIIPLAKELLQKNKIVIFDGCIYHQKVLDYLIRQLHFPHYVFTLKAPLDTCISRDNARKKTIGKGVAKEVHNLVYKNNFGTVINNENLSVDETIREVLKHLPKKNTE